MNENYLVRIAMVGRNVDKVYTVLQHILLPLPLGPLYRPTLEEAKEDRLYLLSQLPDEHAILSRRRWTFIEFRGMTASVFRRTVKYMQTVAQAALTTKNSLELFLTEPETPDQPNALFVLIFRYDDENDKFLANRSS